MNLNLSERILKHKAGNGKSKTISIILLVLLIISGYIFFFSSQLIFGKNYDYEASLPGMEMALDSSHKIKLVRSDIDDNKNLLEYEFEFTNTNYDSSDEYKININSVNKKGKITSLKHNVVCSDSDLYVIRVQPPKKWIAISISVSILNDDMKLKSDKFYSDRNSLYSTVIKDELSREYFLKLDTKRNIETIETDIEKLVNDNISLELKIAEIDNSIKSLKEKMTYMTSEDLKSAETELQRLKHDKSSFKTQIDSNKKEIKELRHNIGILESKL